MDPIMATVHFMHLAGGAAWLGGSLFANLFLVPYTLRQPIDRRRDLTRTLILGPERIMIGAALLAAVTGLARGTLFGQITTLQALGRPYGLVWLLSIVVTVIVFATGGRLTGPAARRLANDSGIWDEQSAAAVRQREVLSRRLAIGFRIELGGILVVLGLMVVLRTL